MRDRIQIKLDAQIPHIFEEKCKKDIKSAIRAHSKYGGTVQHFSLPLRKHAYSNIWKISPPKTENFQTKNSDIFIFLLKTEIVGTH